jgi:hypothetical protein
MRLVAVQFQPTRAGRMESAVRQALRDAMPDAEVTAGDEEGERYETFVFRAESPAEAVSRLSPVLDTPALGVFARRSCIATCQCEHGWEDYLLLHHFDPTMVLDGRGGG